MTRKEGAQPKNKNALKHGIYSQFILLRDDTDMEGMSTQEMADELDMARVNFVTSMQKRAETIDLKDWLACDFSAHYWFDSIVNLKSTAFTNKETAGEVWDQFIDALRAANDRQGWKH